MQIKVYKFTGLTPLLMSSIKSVGDPDLPKIKLGTIPNKGDIEKIATAMTYRNEQGQLYMPTQALRSSLLVGSAGTKFAGSRQAPKTIFQATVFPAEEQAVLLNDKGKPIKDWEIQIDSGVNKANKKQTIRHMSGKALTNQQAAANDKLSGMNQLFYVNQLVTLLENDLIETDNADLIAGLTKLQALLRGFVKRSAA